MTVLIKVIQQPTQRAWLDQALGNLDLLLLDHAHCERKAAGVALQLIFRYPAHALLVRQLTELAREELEHAQRVDTWLEKRAIPLAPLPAPPYASGLKALVRRPEPEQLLDSLLVAALIEARSHERLALLAQHCPDPELAHFYGDLVASEARHYGLYWLLAKNYAPDPQAVDQRLAVLAYAESNLLAVLHPQPRMHS